MRDRSPEFLREDEDVLRGRPSQMMDSQMRDSPEVRPSPEIRRSRSSSPSVHRRRPQHLHRRLSISREDEAPTGAAAARPSEVINTTRTQLTLGGISSDRGEDGVAVGPAPFTATEERRRPASAPPPRLLGADTVSLDSPFGPLNIPSLDPPSRVAAFYDGSGPTWPEFPADLWPKAPPRMIQDPRREAGLPLAYNHHAGKWSALFFLNFCLGCDTTR